jgi:signal transduction histidine kinase
MLDETKIRRVIDNLVRNAIQAMPDGGCLDVKMYEKDGVIFIEVSDTGKGIDPEKLDIIFQPFYTTKAAGMGLGLTYCKEAVESHNGSITVRSRLNKGTIFTISLPIE